MDAIRNGKLGNAQKYLSVITALEHKLSNEYNNPTFSIEQRKSMKNGWDYATKELELIFNKNTFSKKDKYTATEAMYERVLKSADTPQKCQIIIDKLLDNGAYKQFDTPEEIQNLIIALEEKKSQFPQEEVAIAENPQLRSEMKVARELNGFATKKLFEESRKLSDRTSEELKNMSPWAYSALWWEAKITGKANPYEQIASKYMDFSNAVCELSNSVDSLTPEEFGKKATQVLGTEKYNVELVQKLSKQHTDYQTALALKTTNELIKLEYSKENLEKIENTLGKSRIEKEVEGYKNLSPEDKFKFLQLNLKENVNYLNQTLKNKSGEDVINTYENNYKEFLKMVGVEDINEELDDFRTKSEILGTATKIVFVIGASAFCIMTAGAAAGALSVGAAATRTMTWAAGGIGAFSASSLPELYARDGEIKNNIVQQYIDNPDILAHSTIDGLTAGSATAVGTVLSQVGKNALTRYGALLVADGVIGTSAAYAHAKYDGRELSGKDLALTLGVSTITAGIGARTGARIQNTKAASHSKTSGTNNLNSKPREPRLAPMYRNKPATTSSKTATLPTKTYTQIKAGAETTIPNGTEIIINGNKHTVLVEKLVPNEPISVGDNGKIGFVMTRVGDKLHVKVVDCDFQVATTKTTSQFAPKTTAQAFETTTNEISITADPVYPQYKRINLRGNEYSIEKSLARTLNNMENGCTYKLISKNGKLIMDKSSDFYSNGYLITKENGKLILMD